ncbi:glycoside hydrolase domain-containing protein [Actinomadura scrupuli]|uniref:glycoside hydrolase domain-containing protein n=1 Tax=Actinomadura scrupuli TaxID=559629 RepID=UPI003D982F73
MSVFGIDYAWGRPSITALKNAGVKFVARYLSHDTSGKNLTADEARKLSDAGIWIVVVWETTASRALAGRAAGVADAKAAAAQAKACGMPSGRPIYFAVDFDATSSQQDEIHAYLDGAASVLGRGRIGVYAGYGPVRRAFNAKKITYAWQTYAWSGGNWDSRAQLQQYSNNHTVGGVDCDYDRAMKSDYGQWRVGVSPAPPPPAVPQDDDLPTGRLAEGAQAITPIALPRGRYKTIGFTADNNLQGLPPAELRVAVHQAGSWHLATATVDSGGQTVVTFPDPGTTDGISVRREDAGDVHVAWEVS